MRRIKKTAKFSLLGCFALMLYGIATSSGAGWLYVISAALAGVLAVSVLSTLTSARGVEARRHTPPVGTAGEPLPCVLEIRSAGRLSKTLMEIEDDFAGGAGRAVVARIKPGVPERVEYEIETPRRGVYSDGETLIESAAPFGLLASRRILRTASATTIYPKTFEVAGIPRPSSPEAAESGRDEAEAPHRGSGGEFWGVREYRPGDPARLIAWRQSARSAPSGRLAVMEMARETDPPLSVALDLDADAPPAAIELVVSAAASLLLCALREGRGIVADAGPQNAPFPESPDRDSVLGWCASVRSLPSVAPGGDGGNRGVEESYLYFPTPPPPPFFHSSRRSRGEATTTVEIIPSVGRVRVEELRSDTIILVSCHEFAGAGPWMSPEEEREFMDEVEASGRRAMRLGPDVPEPWEIS